MIKADKNISVIPLTILFLIFAFAPTACADTFTVTNYDPNGAGSFSQAIDDVNSHGATSTIEFNESAASGTIDLTGYVTSLGFETTLDLNSYDVTLTNYVGGCTSWTKFDGATTGVLNIGSGSNWTNTWGVVIGDNTNGSLTVSNGGDFTVSNEKTYIGSTSADSVGVLTVTGTGSTYVTNNDIDVGLNGTGTLTVADSATVNVNGGAGTVNVASAAGSVGTVNIGNGAAAGTLTAAEVAAGAGTAKLVFNHTSAALTFSPVISGAMSVEHNGTGTTTISGVNTYTGTTTINAGTVKLGDDSALGDQTSGTTINSGGSMDLNGHDLFTAGEDEPLSIAGTGTAGEGALFNSSAGMSTYSGTITLTADSTIGVSDAAGSMLIYRNINTGAAGYDITFTGAGDFLIVNNLTGKITGNGDVNKSGAGELLLYMTGDDYTGATNINEGKFTLGASGVIPDASAINIAAGAEFDLNGKNETIGSLSGAGNVINRAGACTLVAGGNDSSTTYSGVIADGTAATAFTKEGTGTLIFSGANTYTGTTTINAGTLRASNASAVGTGALTNNATLDIGSTTLTFNGVYTQAAGSTLRLNAASVSSFGSIVSAADAVVSAASAVNVTITEYLPNNATLKIIDGAGGAGVNVPATITSSNSRYTLIGSSVGGDLILTVNRSGPGQGFAGDATNSNTAAVGAVLDNISDPTDDMADVLNALEGLNNAEVGSSLDTLIPVVDGGVIASSNLSLGQFIGTVTDRLTGLFARARDGETGVSAGCEGLQGFEAWGQGFGEYLRQEPRGSSNGYRATVWGTAIGGDIPAFNNRVRMGLSGGYAQSGINSKDNSGKTDIDSYQGTLYAGYADAENPYYLNGAFSFAYNKYDSSRHIAVGTIMRTANSDYDGQQYSVLLDGGYTFKSGEFGITPMASLQYERLHLEGYTEKNAGALNLHVNSQNYDLLQSGLGMKLERPFKTETGTIIPEIHAKWLYDFIGDRQETTSTFSGGGGSFATNGFDPAQNSLNAGAKVTLIANNNWVLETNYDFEYKEDFTAHTGWADVRYKF